MLRNRNSRSIRPYDAKIFLFGSLRWFPDRGPTKRATWPGQCGATEAGNTGSGYSFRDVKATVTSSPILRDMPIGPLAITMRTTSRIARAARMHEMKAISRSRWLLRATIGVLALAACSASRTDVIAQHAPIATSPSLAKLDFSKSTPVDEAYRQQFTNCDTRSTFDGLTFLFTGDRGRKWFGWARVIRTIWSGWCASRALARQRKQSCSSSKLGVDYDGSFVAAHTPGMTDLKDTSLELRGPSGDPVPTYSNVVPYVVMPNSGPTAYRGH